MAEISFSTATEKDIAFITDSILYSERSGATYSFYESAFDLTEEEFKKFISSILLENIPGSELCLENFTILFYDGEPATTLSWWIEGKDNQSSNFIKASLFSYFLDEDKWLNAQKAIKLINEIAIERKSEHPQIESVYVAPIFRGKGLLSELMNFVSQEISMKSGNDIQMISLLSNQASLRAFKKCNFEISEKTESKNKEILNFLPSLGKILWTRKNIANG